MRYYSYPTFRVMPNFSTDAQLCTNTFKADLNTQPNLFIWTQTLIVITAWLFHILEPHIQRAPTSVLTNTVFSN